MESFLNNEPPGIHFITPCLGNSELTYLIFTSPVMPPTQEHN